jgi:hypothetical protein
VGDAALCHPLKSGALREDGDDRQNQKALTSYDGDCPPHTITVHRGGQLPYSRIAPERAAEPRISWLLQQLTVGPA